MLLGAALCGGGKEGRLWLGQVPSSIACSDLAVVVRALIAAAHGIEQVVKRQRPEERRAWLAGSGMRSQVATGAASRVGLGDCVLCAVP